MSYVETVLDNPVDYDSPANETRYRRRRGEKAVGSRYMEVNGELYDMGDPHTGWSYEVEDQFLKQDQLPVGVEGRKQELPCNEPDNATFVAGMSDPFIDEYAATNGNYGSERVRPRVDHVENFHKEYQYIDTDQCYVPPAYGETSTLLRQPFNVDPFTRNYGTGHLAKDVERSKASCLGIEKDPVAQCFKQNFDSARNMLSERADVFDGGIQDPRPIAVSGCTDRCGTKHITKDDTYWEC